MFVHVEARIASPSQDLSGLHFDDERPGTFTLAVFHRRLQARFQHGLHVGIQRQVHIVAVHRLCADIARARQLGTIRGALILHPSVFAAQIIFQRIFQSHLSDDALFILIIARKTDQMGCERTGRIIAVAGLDEVDARQFQIPDRLHRFLADALGPCSQFGLCRPVRLCRFHRRSQGIRIDALSEHLGQLSGRLIDVNDISRLSIELSAFIQIGDDRIGDLILCDHRTVAVVDRSALCHRRRLVDVGSIQGGQHILLAPQMLMRKHRKKDIHHYQCPCYYYYAHQIQQSLIRPFQPHMTISYCSSPSPTT